MHQKNLFYALVVFLIAILCNSIKAQNPEEYNAIYTKAYLEISQKDFPKALRIADSLYQVSETPKFQAKSLMLSATLLQQSGDFSKAVDYALKANKILEGTSETLWKAKVSGFLATQYRHLKLFDQSKKYIGETENTIKNISDPRMVNQTLGFLMQEKAYYEMEHKHYSKAIILIHQSSKYFESSGQSSPFLDANNEQLLGLSYYHLQNYKGALEYYRNALDKLEKMPDNFMKALVINGMAEVYLAQKNPELAKPLIEQAQKLAEESPYLSLKNEILETSQQYYALVKDIEKLELTKQKQDSVNEKIQDRRSEFINKSYTKLAEDNESAKAVSGQKNTVIVAIFAGFLLVLGLFLSYRKRQQYKYKKFQEIISKLELEQSVTSQPQQVNNLEIEDHAEPECQPEPEDTTTNMLMTPATEKKILLRLEKFENAAMFTKASVSLPYVAAYCNTNTKYLSYIVNTYKKKDFKNYINELRIRYIILKLTTNRSYRKFKVASLAAEAGFSSRSRFATEFKKITTLSPSEFIEQLQSNDSN